MRKTKFTRLLAACALLLVLGAGQAFADGFTLTSPDMREGGILSMKQVLNGFGCTGENISPALAWKNAPRDAESFAITVYDPDAPTGSGWWHWVVYNIPANVHTLKAGAGNNKKLLPDGAVQGRTDFGSAGYGGACPPEGHGDHRYIFTVHALDVELLDLAPESSAAMVGFFLNAHTLDKAVLTTTFGR